jgi:hypothetical protein
MILYTYKIENVCWLATAVVTMLAVVVFGIALVQILPKSRNQPKLMLPHEPCRTLGALLLPYGLYLFLYPPYKPPFCAQEVKIFYFWKSPLFSSSLPGPLK